MKKRMLRSVLATAFVVALAGGAAGPLEDVGWSSPTVTSSAAVADPGDVGWSAPADDGTPGDVGWSTPAGADA
jgi:hypothetical protein